MEKPEISKKILLAAAGVSATGGALAALDVDKSLHSLALWYKNQDRRNRYRIRKVFSELRQGGLIEVPAGEISAKIFLTEAGRKRVFQYQIKEMRLRPVKKWDKKWRVVIVDAPKNLRKERAAFIKKLKRFGFRQIQKNAWTYPYECRDEINAIKDFFGLSDSVKLIEAARIDGEEALRRQFDL